MAIVSGSVILTDAENSVSESFVGLARAIPPKLAGRARRSRSEAFGGGLPVSAGASTVLSRINVGLGGCTLRV